MSTYDPEDWLPEDEENPWKISEELIPCRSPEHDSPKRLMHQPEIHYHICPVCNKKFTFAKETNHVG